MLNGPYAFLLQGFSGKRRSGDTSGSGGQLRGQWKLGGITSGSVDLSNLSGHQQLAISNISNAYTVGSNGQGCVTLTFPGPTTATFHFVLGGVFANGAPTGVASTGRIIEFDDYSGSGNRNHLSGVLRRQDTAAFLTGNTANLQSRYAFGEDGVISGNGHVAVAGSVSLDKITGAITGGVFDSNSAGSLTTNVGLSGGSITGVNSGTGRAVLSTTSTFGTFNDAIYIVNTNEFFFVSTDAFSTVGSILSGRAIKTLSSYTASTPAGSDIFHETGIDTNANNNGNSSCSSSAPCAVSQVGIVTFTSGTSTLSVTSTSIEAGSSKSDSISITYTVDSASGRITLSGVGVGAGEAPVLYIATPVSGSGAANTEPISVFFVESDSTAALGVGEPQPQPVTYSNTSLAGNFMFGGEDAGQNASFPQVVGQGSVSGGTGAIVVNRDRSGPGGLFLSGAPVTFNFAVASDGTVTGIIATSAVGATNGKKLFEVDPNGTPAIIRTFEQQ